MSDSEFAPETESATVPPAPLPPERLVPGLLLSLLAIPLGIVAFGLLSGFGYIVALAGIGVAAAAFFLYRLGSGGRVSIGGAVAVGAVTIVGIVGGVAGARAVTLAQSLATTYGLDVWQVLFAADFPSRVADVFSTPGYLAFLAQQAALPLIVGVIGCVTLVRGALRDTQ